MIGWECVVEGMWSYLRRTAIQLHRAACKAKGISSRPTKYSERGAVEGRDDGGTKFPASEVMVVEEEAGEEEVEFEDDVEEVPSPSPVLLFAPAIVVSFEVAFPAFRFLLFCFPMA